MFVIRLRVCPWQAFFSLVKCLKVKLETTRVKVLHSRVAPGLFKKHWTRLERLARDNHYSLFHAFINCSRENIYNNEPIIIFCHRNFRISKVFVLGKPSIF